MRTMKMIKVTILPFMSSTAYTHAETMSDYQLDMAAVGLTELDNVHVQQLPENPLLYKSMPEEERRKSWGLGWSLYGLLDEPQERFPVEDSDAIIIGLHHTGFQYSQDFYEFVKEVGKVYGKNRISVIDGQDNPSFYDEIAEQAKVYYKRELLDHRNATPIFFGIPEQKISSDVDISEGRRTYDFSPMIPANHSWPDCPHLKSYIYKTEEEYYNQYRQSYYSYSTKKGGWATGRQNEIWACNSLPFITDIEKCPTNCLYRYPKEFCVEIKKTRGVFPGTISPYHPEDDTYIGDTRQIKEGEERGYIDWDKFDLKQYYSYLSEFKSYCRSNLTTKALARYILETSL